jgi:hypothetical protein
MGGVIVDAEVVADQLGDAPGGPDVAAPAMGLGALGQQGRDLRALLGGEQGRRPGRGLGAPGCDAGGLSAFEPAADEVLAAAEGGDAALLGPTELMEFPGAAATAFPPVEGLGGDLGHGPILP